MRGWARDEEAMEGAQSHFRLELQVRPRIRSPAGDGRGVCQPAGVVVGEGIQYPYQPLGTYQSCYGLRRLVPMLLWLSLGQLCSTCSI